jgi:IS30 family transposase
MGTKYLHLSQAERWAIEFSRGQGLSFAEIGKALGRHRSTIMREWRRGYARGFDRYLAEFGRRYYMNKRSAAGHARRKLDALMRKPAWSVVMFGLRQEWSPQQISDRLRDGALPVDVVPAGLRTLSHETIYRAIYGMPAGQQHAQLVRMLRRSLGGRRRPRKANGRRFTGVQNMRPLSERPQAAELRLEPGHWEGDLIKGAGGRSHVGTLVDRHTRMTLLVKLDSAHADHVARVCGTAGHAAGGDAQIADVRPRHGDGEAPGVHPTQRDPGLLLRRVQPLAARDQRKHQRPDPAIPAQGYGSVHRKPPGADAD